MVRFEPNERHALRSEGGARVLLLLAPWPGDGHYRGNPPQPPLKSLGLRGVLGERAAGTSGTRCGRSSR